MNKVILMGRLTRNPEIRYSQQGLAVARYTLAVNKRIKQQGQPEADFISCVTFGKLAEIAEKYLNQGQQIAIVGRLQVRSWENEVGKKQWSTEVVVDEQYFADSKRIEQNTGNESQKEDAPKGFYPASENDDNLPF